MKIATNTLERMKTLTELHGAPGFEDKVRSYMKKEMEPFADEIMQDGLGGIFALKKSKVENAPKVMIAGHMDEVGFMVTQLADNGMIKFTPLGGWSNDVLLSHKFKVRTSEDKEITGVIGSVPVHFRKGEGNKPVQLDDMLLDVGADSREDLESMGIRPGDSIVPDVNFEVLEQENKLLAKAWDNRYGCLIAIETLEALADVELDCDLYVGANVQEEVGLRGAKVSANMIKPDIAFAVDCSPANDMLGNKDDIGKIGEGTLVRIMDRTMILSKPMRDYMLETADAHDIKFQYYQSPGGTDAGSIHVSNEGVVSAVVGIVARYIHTSHSIINAEDYMHAKTMLTELVRGIDHDRVAELRGQ
ncbi:M42 family metallopeptidase [Salinicoccus sp. ID82-1]|uniref:M42 family metallopeptidase n=1 Tax=Salinicoccus cyprini TaxID=2493691 RepID=A0A558AZS3_9STAP|nr:MULTISPECIES: M42 family metallopeptidase [Salinicoccus]MCG1009381.1 M42 family metallopeptidase [Salinicoccus sp. ID82-1]TVT29753.1 M42 family metallopeptidase [Salinicoccus cyprini]